MDALSAWGLHAHAAQLFRYWLANFVRDNGTIKYYGPSIAEYGQLLHTAAFLDQRACAAGWWETGRKALDRMAEHQVRRAAGTLRVIGVRSVLSLEQDVMLCRRRTRRPFRYAQTPLTVC